LRLLRAVRFAARLGFTIEPETFAAIQKHAEKIKLVSAERVRDELNKIFAPPHAARGLSLLHETGLLPHVLPEFVPTLTCEQSPQYHPEGSVYNHVRLMLDHLPRDGDAAGQGASQVSSESLAWSAILHDIAKPQTASQGNDGLIHFYGHEKVGADIAEQLLQRLKFPRRQTDEIVAAVRHHMQFKDAPKMRKATLRRMLLRDTFPLELALHRLDCLGSHRRLDIYDFLVEQQAHLSERPHLLPPLLTGNDLLALGVEPGPKIGALLAELRDKQLGEEITDSAQAMEWVKAQLQSVPPRSPAE
jgi:putative nucleotidyltransferase with HDIG domain